MTPKEKAIELVKKYIEFKIDGRPRIFGIALSKQFALIAVDEILELICCMDGKEHWQEYYEQVKHEIENI